MSEISGQPPAPSRTPDVSIVVPTRGREELLSRCLSTLLHQTLSAERYEVLVVDDGPSAETAEVVHDAAASGDVAVSYLVTDGGVGPAAARNVGWRAAAAPILAFTDDDTVPDLKWLEAGLAALTADFAAATGRIIIPLPPEPTDYERDAARLADAGFVTANCFFRRSALEAIGGFDERFREAWREDTDAWFSLLDKGLRLTNAPDAVVVHPIRPAPWGVSVSQQSKAEYNPLLYKKHPQLYRERIGHSPRWYYAPSLAAVGAFAALLFGRRRSAGVLGAAWLAMTGVFALRRLEGTSKRPAHVAEMALTSALIPPLSVYRRLKGAVRYRTLFW